LCCIRAPDYRSGTCSRAKEGTGPRSKCGQCHEEILNIPDDIPQSVIDKADCIVVLPSVIKFAFGFGGSYGRGVMTCRGGEDFKGPWGAPTMMALEGEASDFRLADRRPTSCCC